ncbi:MAG: ATP-binding protein [Rhodomicrobium sp.]
MPGKLRLSRLATKFRIINPYLGSFLVTAIFLGFALALPERTGPWSAGVILLMAVLASASIWGLKQGLLASLLAVTAYDFFFIPPVYTLDIDNWQDALSLFLFGLAATTVSMLAENLSRRTLAARRNEILAKRLYAFGKRLREAQDIVTIANDAVASIGVAVGAKVMLLVPKGGVLTVVAAHPARALLNDVEIEAVKRACEYKLRQIGEATGNAGVTCTRLAVDNSLENSAVLVVCETRRRFWQLPDRMRIIDMLAGPASSAFRRVALQKLAEDARIAAETESLRAALLTSISHDLKTPLAIILGSASSLKELGTTLDERTTQDLLHSILEEGERLNQFIANLLDMSHIESEAVRPKQQLADLSDIVGSALQRAARALSRHRVVVEVPDDIPSLDLDPVLMEKALFNILENAANYTPLGTQVTLSVAKDSASVIIQIRDEGPGIPAQELPHLFDKFYRGGAGAWKPTGTGLGLAISRGFIQAMGGVATASNRQDRSGAVFTIKLPIRPAKTHLSQFPPLQLAS